MRGTIVSLDAINNQITYLWTVEPEDQYNFECPACRNLCEQAGEQGEWCDHCEALFILCDQQGNRVDLTDIDEILGPDMLSYTICLTLAKLTGHSCGARSPCKEPRTVTTHNLNMYKTTDCDCHTFNWICQGQEHITWTD